MYYKPSLLIVSGKKDCIMFNLSEQIENDQCVKLFADDLAKGTGSSLVYKSPVNFGFAVDRGDRKKIRSLVSSVIGYTSNAAIVDWMIIPYCQD
jgi:hypothetical protein